MHQACSNTGWLDLDIKLAEVRRQGLGMVLRNARLPGQHVETSLRNHGPAGIESVPRPPLWEMKPSTLISPSNLEWALRQLARNPACHLHAPLLCSQTLEFKWLSCNLKHWCYLFFMALNIQSLWNSFGNNQSKEISLFFFPIIFISWRLITLQYCSGFCHTLTWISHGFTCVPHPESPSPSHPSGSSVFKWLLPRWELRWKRQSDYSFCEHLLTPVMSPIPTTHLWSNYYWPSLKTRKRRIITSGPRFYHR